MEQQPIKKPWGNPFQLGNPGGGRNRIFETPEEMEKMIDEYFLHIQGKVKKIFNEGLENEKVLWEREPEPATITGLALYIGLCSKTSLYEYQDRPAFSDLVKRARAGVENAYEKRLHQAQNVGAIFALKNMGWRDKQEVGLTDVEGKDILHDKSEEELKELLEKKLTKIG